MSAEATDFYITGGTLQQDAPSYVERRADTDLFEALTRGEFCYVLTSRQMGKSSLMIHTAARLREAGIAVAVLDLTAIGQNLSPEQWYDGLRELLGISLELEDELDDFWRDHRHLGPLQRWMAALRQVVLAKVPGRVVLFVDEIDAVRSLPFSTDEFFSGVRECYNRRTQEPEYARLVFCLLGVASPADLISDTRTSPFNIGRRIELTDFTVAEAAPLTRGLQRDQPQRHEGHEERQWFKPSRGTLLDRVLYWTGGQPYLTQRLCRAIAEDGNAATPADVDRLCAGLFLTRKAQDVDDNLAFVRNRLLRAEVDLAGLLELYRQVQRSRRVLDDETNPLVTVLRLSGVVRAAGGVLQVRNRIYDRVFDQEWVVAHMPDAELRRQRAAYHRGLVRASALAAIMLALVGSLAFTAASQASRAQRGERQARREALRAQTSAEEARRLAAWLQIALREKEGAFTRLRASLAAEQTQRQRAGQAAEQARQAERRERAQRLQADAARTEAEQQRQVAVVQREAAVNARAQAITQRRRAEQETRRAQRHLYFANMNLAPQHWESANVGRLRQLLEETQGNPERGFEWAYWQRLRHLELQTLRGHTAGVHAVAFSPDGRRSVTGSDDKTAKVWDTETGRETLTLRGHLLPIGSVAFSLDGRRIATGSFDPTAKVWDAASGRLLLTLKGHSNNVTAVAFSPDGRHLITGSDDNTARVWDAAHERVTLPLLGASGVVRSVAVSPDGRRMVTATRGDNAARVWDAATGRPALALQGHTAPVWCVAVSPDGRRIATGSLDRTARVWDVTTGRSLFTLRGHTGWVTAVAFSLHGGRLLTASWDQTAKVWDLATGREIATLIGQGTRISSAAFSPDGRHLLMGSQDDGSAKLWDLLRGRELLSLAGHQGGAVSVAFSPDGGRLLTGGGDQTAKVWDAASGDELLTLRGHTGAVTAVAFCPDGRRLVTASADATAKVWDAASGREVLTLKGHTAPILCVALSPDGRQVLTGGEDQTVQVWQAASPQQIAVWSAAERATEREQQERAALAAARNALQVVASSRGGAIRLQWRPVPGALGYRLSRAPADAQRARWVALTARPVAGPAFTDRGPGLVPGRPLAYTVASLVKRGGKVTQGPQVTLQATPVTLPPGWTGSSINEGGLSGSAVFHRTTREITLRGSGALAEGPADEGYFLNQPVTGDFQITVRMLTTPTMTHLVARAGLMIRESLAASARMAHLLAVPIRVAWLEWRPTTNGNLSFRPVIETDQFKLPLTLRLTRQGDTLRAESSLDEGKSFQPAGDPLRFTPPLPPTLYVGLEICSLDANQRSEATFRDLTIEKLFGGERR